MKAIDTASVIDKSIAAAFRNDGIEAVFGYLGPWSKCLTPARLQILRDAGYFIGFFFEDDPTYAKYFSLSQGQADANVAIRHAEALGVPHGTGICYTVDYDAQTGDIPSICAYLAGVKHATTGKYRVGLYAKASILQALRDEVDYLIEPSAWANGAQVTGVAAYQNSVSVARHGISVDIDDVYEPSILWTPPNKGGNALTALKIQINGQPQEDGIQVQVGNDYVTYVPLTVFIKNGIPVEQVGDKYIAHGVTYTAETNAALEPFLPWTALGVGVIPKKIADGWNFVIPIDVPASSSSSVPSIINGQEVVDVIEGTVNPSDGKFYFPAKLNGVAVDVVLDTGALRLEVTEQVGQDANLPNDGPAYLGGVGGSGQAGYSSTGTLGVGTKTFPNTPIYVVGSVFNLLGSTFLNDNGLDLLLSYSTNKAYFLKRN
ncbi:glycoside hydrolase domain-containing protein [Alicyclobacillus ferrooxydans]|uniref:Peptidase A2 domain-containing protein n=1 Tax=Alicyclobacillus ferrooxydans TaxID=471514 RepID=A0A0P9EHD9_9BACL|nr:glycoside hydrolase domain-containing protein [Alicyclobacillus ferrooxydans]KPV42034.1 hypothetical protein AN477_19895 [Alicyclobacillus ferrooxydans]